jgi:hypothetical protein
MSWLASNSTVIAAIVQAGAAVIIVWLTYKLIGVTDRYATSTDKALDLSRQQFEREWQPDIRIASVYMDGLTATAVVVNLARPAVLLTGIIIGAGEEPNHRVEIFAKGEFLPGDRDKTIKIHSDLASYRGRHKSINVHGTRNQWHIRMGLAFEYVRAGTKGQTPLVTCDVLFEDYAVVKIEAVT